jgi:hypothetical protein
VTGVQTCALPICDLRDEVTPHAARRLFAAQMFDAEEEGNNENQDGKRTPQGEALLQAFAVYE